MQALNLFNSSFVSQQSEAFAQRVKREAGDEAGAQVHHATGWPSGGSQIARKLAVPLLQEHGLPVLCRVVLNVNEFVFIQ